MLKINPAFCFKPEELIGFVKQVSKESTLSEEIAAAVTYRLIFEEELGWENYYIYFEPSNSSQKELLQKVGTNLTYADLEPFINQFSEQSTPVDFAFINIDKQPADVYPVQHKRYFPKYKNEKQESEAFINELNKWRKQYADSETTMLIHYKGDMHAIDLDPVMINLKKNGFPFREVMMLIMTDDGPIFLQIYPNDGDGSMGFNHYSKKRMLDFPSGRTS